MFISFKPSWDGIRGTWYSLQFIIQICLPESNYLHYCKISYVVFVYLHVIFFPVAKCLSDEMVGLCCVYIFVKQTLVSGCCCHRNKIGWVKFSEFFPSTCIMLNLSKWPPRLKFQLVGFKTVCLWCVHVVFISCFYSKLFFMI